VHDVTDLDSLRQSLAKIGDVRVTSGLATVSIVGDGLSSDPHLPADAARALRDLPVHLVARPAGKRTLSFVVDAEQSGAAMSRLHECFFGVAGRPAPSAGPVVQA
jgi:aspartate kinase